MGCSPFMEDVAEALAVAVRVKRPAVQVRSLRASAPRRRRDGWRSLVCPPRFMTKYAKVGGRLAEPGPQILRLVVEHFVAGDSFDAAVRAAHRKDSVHGTKCPRLLTRQL